MVCAMLVLKLHSISNIYTYDKVLQVFYLDICSLVYSLIKSFNEQKIEYD